MDEAYVFGTFFSDLGKWSYCLNGNIKYGESKGTTKDQMYLMGILQLLRDDDISEEIQIYIPDERIYKIMIGEYKRKPGIISDYLQEIDWAIGKIKITYIYVKEEKLISYPFYIAIQRTFQGRHGLYFDLDGKDSEKFEVNDPFNGNILEGYLCRIPDMRYGMLYIEFVNGEYCPQWIWATPKIRYPFGVSGIYRSYDIDRIEMYIKLDGSNVVSYIYEDIDENRYVTYKTRLTPIIKDGKWGRFEKMWREMLDRYPKIPEFCLDNNVNVSFEMYGSRNFILVEYDVKLDIALLFCRTQDGVIHPPSIYDLEKYGLKSAQLWKVLDSSENFQEDYEKAVEELNQQLKVIEIPDGIDIVKGWEGAIYYMIKNDNIILTKCKPDYIRDIHFAAAMGIPKHSIYITCLNIFESKENPKLEDVIELLKEEFQENEIQQKIEAIERIYHYVRERMILRHDVIDEYEKHSEFDIIEDKRKVMRHFSKIYKRKAMSKVYAILWTEFGEDSENE